MKTNRVFKVVEKSKLWFTIAGLIILVALGSILIRGLNFGIDFQGGTIITIDLHQKFETEDVKAITDEYDKDADITYSGEEQETVIISSKESLTTDQQKELYQAFQEKYELEEKQPTSVDNVSPAIGSETARNAILACLVAVALMLIYITIRFEFYFGLAAVICLAFDITVVIGLYALLQIQVNSPFIAAVLTILGYSINDTIVIFDRIRENETLIGISDLNYLVDASISQTMTRSIYTSVTTLLAILALYIFGETAIRNFALPLIVGIISGAFSSIFVAAQLWVVFQRKFPNSKMNQRQRKQESKRKRKKKKDPVQL